MFLVATEEGCDGQRGAAICCASMQPENKGRRVDGQPCLAFEAASHGDGSGGSNAGEWADDLQAKKFPRA